MEIEPSTIETGKLTYRFSDFEKQEITDALYARAKHFDMLIEDIRIIESIPDNETCDAIQYFEEKAKSLKDIADIFTFVKGR